MPVAQVSPALALSPHGPAYHAGPFPGVDVDVSGDQLGDVVGKEQALIGVRIPLGEQKRFMECSLLIHIADIQPGITSVMPPAAEHNPPAVS